LNFFDARRNFLIECHGNAAGLRADMIDGADRLYERLLVLRCKAGDQQAFAEIVERYRLRMHYYLRKMLGEVHAAEDALQDVWLDVYRSMPRLADAGAFRAWLYRIARDRACRELRKRRPLPQAVEDFGLIEDEAEEPTFSAEDAERIHAALDTLAPDHREALLLQFVEDLSYQEIAQVMGCQLGTVRSRIHYAKCELRAVLERMKLKSNE
jgi:RNA polymerase sigma-70 factor, ECF subfamily